MEHAPATISTAHVPRTSRRTVATALMLVGVLLLQVYSRYGVCAVTDFTVDDWGQLERVSWFPGYGAIWRYSLQDVNRPIHLGMLITTFRWLGDNPASFFVFGAVVNSLLLAAGMGLVYALTRRFRSTLLYGTAFSLWPTLTESFHFWTHVSLAYVYISYIAGALCWILYTRRQQGVFLAGSLVLYAIGLGSYEFGIALPLIFMIALTGRPLRRRLITVAPFLAVAALFVLWRSTQGFGFGQYLAVGQQYLRADLSIPDLTWNAREILSWWAGSRALSTIRNGLAAFAALSPQVRLTHAAIGVVIGLLVYAGLRPSVERQHSGPSGDGLGTGRVVAFGLLWATLGQAPNLLIAPSARHLAFPLIGILVAASAALDRVWNRKLAVLLALAAPICLLVNHGTSVDWSEAGEFNRQLYTYVGKTVSEWEDKELVVFDTRSIQPPHRAEAGELGFSDPLRWAYHGNAHLLRGFAVQAMMRLSQKGGPPPLVLLDAEHGARVAGNRLLWHEQYNPVNSHSTPLDRVYVFDCAKMARGSVRNPNRSKP
jgi:hypothetical protein